MGTNISFESYPIRETLDGWDDEYSSVDEFKQHLTPDSLSISEANKGWVFWSTPETEYSSVFRGRITEKITHVLSKLFTSLSWLSKRILVQFWAPEEVGGRCCLTTLHQPFAVGESLVKGLSWLRNKCMQHLYYIADQGAPARVFRNGNPESSPHILLYSTKEFPLQDLAFACGLSSYLALPIFEDQCVGVPEFFIDHDFLLGILLGDCSSVGFALQEFGLRLAHKFTGTAFQNKLQEPRDIREMLDLAIENVPQLHVAQVWVPCNQCGNNNNCMRLAEFKTKVNSDILLKVFHEACEFNNLQNGQGILGFALSSTNKWRFHENISGFSISEYPMAHHAQRARLSSCFTICLSRTHNGNDPHVFQFFLQPQSRDNGASIQSILYLLLKIMEKKLKSFEISAEQYLGGEYQQLKQHIMVMIPIEKYEGTFSFSVSEFEEFFQDVELSCLQDNKWLCWSMKEKELSEKRGNYDTSMPQLNQGVVEIKRLLSELIILDIPRRPPFCCPFLIQFRAPKLIGKRLFLSTSEQPFALSHLQKGLCWYRKQCIQYLYYIGDGANEEELGPPGRVFLNGHPESSPDLRLYSKREFPLWDHVVQTAGARSYLALPLFHLFDKQCVGVLEFVGFPSDGVHEIYKKLEKYNLTSTHNCRPSTPPIDQGKKQALSEIEEMLRLVIKSPQLQTASTWISCGQCALNNIEIGCMEQAFTHVYFQHDYKIREFMEACKFLQVHTRKGIIRKVIESETKLYFCENLCGFSICELPLAHYAQEARLDICFAICLKSSYTGNSLHVLEFFLSRHSTKYEYSRTLCFLLSTMKQMLKSFKVASGQQLISDGIDSRTYVEYVSQNITGFSTANQLTVENIGGQSNLPLGTENAQYGHENEHRYSKHQMHLSGTDGGSNIDQEQERNIADAINVEDEAQNITNVNLEEGNERDRSSTSFHVSYEQLKSQFGRSRKDAAKNLGVSISTFKRKCRDYDINRWPSKMNNIKNPSLFRTKVANTCVENADYQTSARSGFDLKTLDFPIATNLSSHPLQKTTELANICQVADLVVKAEWRSSWKKWGRDLS